MRRVLAFILGLAASGCLAAAQGSALAVIPLLGTLRMTEAPWAAAGRLGWAAGFALLAAALALAARTRWLAALLGAALAGFLIDLALSAALWREEKLTLLRDLGGAALEKQIQWGAGAVWLGAAAIFVLAFIGATSYHRAPCSVREVS